MAEPFKDEDEIRAWLETQPRDVISVFAARAGMRTIPLLGYMIINNDNPMALAIEITILRCFSFLARILSVGTWPYITSDLLGVSNAINDPSIRIALMGHAFAAGSASLNGITIGHDAFSSSGVTDGTTASSVGFATSAIADVISIRYNTYNSAALAAKAAQKAAIPNSVFHDLYEEYTFDRHFIESGGSPKNLAFQKIWNASEYFGNSLPFNLDETWQKFKLRLFAHNSDWEVWTEWYEARLKGLPLIKDIEMGVDPEKEQYGRVTLPPEDYENPAKANAAIKKIIDDYLERQRLLEQNNTSETYGLNSDGKIERTTVQTSSELIDTPDQRDWYKALRDAAFGMDDIGENALGCAARPVKNVLNALPEDITEAKIALLWPVANRIRKLKAAHVRAVASGDEYHPNRLANEVIDDIEQFTEVYNNLVIGDIGLSEKDKVGKGPQDENKIIEASEMGTQAIEAAIEHDLFTDDAQESLKENIAEDREIIAKLEADDKLPVLEQLALANTQIAKENAIRAIILRVRESEEYGKIKDGALKAIGVAIVAYVITLWPPLAGMVMKLFGLG